MAPVISALRRLDDTVVRVVSTGQHRDMVRQELAEFQISIDLDLDVMVPNQSLAGLSARILTALDPLLEREQPDLLLVQGDTTSVMIAALCGFYRNIPVGHVEAGLRTSDIRRPFPEELNRRVTTLATTLHFAPTQSAKRALLDEGVSSKSIFLTGNTVIDALLDTAQRHEKRARIGTKTILVTAHRRESFGEPIRDICRAILDLSARFPDYRFIYPVHPNPNIAGPVHELLSGQSNITLCPPMGYADLVCTLRDCHFVMTDSGGIQEEAPALAKPVLVLRDETERPDAVRYGAALLVGTNRETIIAEATRLLTSVPDYVAMKNAGSPYGDGQASRRIAQICDAFLRDQIPVVDEFIFEPQETRNVS
jgi:UDP-N-acetylglucosamine 2-epimerase (non-hydrolysing)